VVHSPSSTRVLIAGVSTRAAAESAARAGFPVTAIDAFADLDQHASVRAVVRTSARKARRARRRRCDAVVFSSFENHPAVSRLAAGRAVGNAPAVLRRCDPLLIRRPFAGEGARRPTCKSRPADVAPPRARRQRAAPAAAGW
jgi:hypothetical protein